MPRLSQEALAKRYACDYCGESFKTRQGLSGHTYFKHESGFASQPAVQTEADTDRDVDALLKDLISVNAAQGSSELRALIDTLAQWPLVRTLLKAQGFGLIGEDLKAYIIVSTAIAHEGQKLQTLIDKKSEEIQLSLLAIVHAIGAKKGL